ncbi:NmrA family NAD(P)-binding protein [soil metagenome]
MKLLVYGATGSQGKPVAQRLIEDGHEVRVLTRDAAHASDLQEAGADIFEGNLSNPESLEEANEGVDGVFLHVPFFTDSPTDGLTYGKNGVDMAKKAGAQLIVWNASGEIPPIRTGNPGFDVRLDVLEHLKNSGVPYVVLQPTAYMENFLGPWTREEIVQDDVFAYPTPLAVKMQWTATADVAKFASYAFKNPDLASLDLKISGPESLNGEEVAERFSRALGRKITFRAMPANEFGDKLDAVFPGMGQGAAQGYAMAYEHPEMFSSNVDTAAAVEKMPVELTPLEAWVRLHKEAFSKQEVPA